MSRNRYKVQDAIQGESGLWIKPALDKAGRRHLFVAETKAGVDGGSHDHYWEMMTVLLACSCAIKVVPHWWLTQRGTFCNTTRPFQLT